MEENHLKLNMHHIIGHCISKLQWARKIEQVHESNATIVDSNLYSILNFKGCFSKPTILI
jgi:hypothetical protein